MQDEANTVDGKACTKCGEVHALERFGRHSGRADGYQKWCRQCVSSYNRARRADRDASPVLSPSERKRFAEKHSKGEGCWEWSASKNSKGYGWFQLRSATHLAHRVSLEDSMGRRIAPGMMALHHCDNPPCVNPDHLYEGTPAQNTADMISRGRNSVAFGEEASGARATRAGVVSARSRYAAGESVDSIANGLPIGHHALREAIRGATWPHVPGAVPIRAQKRVTDSDVRGIVAASRAGDTGRAIAARFDVSESFVSNVINGKARA